jgi:hypothetical protein
MEMRWSHEGVAMRAPVRNARLLRRFAYALLGGGAVVSLFFVSYLAEPAPPPDYSVCAERADRGFGVCDDIRPSYETWSYASKDDYVRARACSLAEDPSDSDLVAYTRVKAGIGYAHNLEFLRMAANQSGACVPETSQWRSIAEREWDALLAIENAYWSERITRAQEAVDTAYERARFVRTVLLNTVPLWLPVLLTAWIVALVAFRRLMRRARPLELQVTTAGVLLDGREIRRKDIAFLSLEGQRLRIERWLGAPVYTRPLPPEALAYADEICAALGSMDDDTEDDGPEPPPSALHALVASTRSRL